MDPRPEGIWGAQDCARENKGALEGPWKVPSPEPSAALRLRPGFLELRSQGFPISLASSHHWKPRGFGDVGVFAGLRGGQDMGIGNSILAGGSGEEVV